ncbi:hypothetical protein AMECASPLE_020782 [Ameca splendens]|uniref:Uncharacterized protein n=1 Tax=Ameca splendens TaxID=208324 RepID=A0ABV1AAL3_9TELE
MGYPGIYPVPKAGKKRGQTSVPSLHSVHSGAKDSQQHQPCRLQAHWDFKPDVFERRSALMRAECFQSTHSTSSLTDQHTKIIHLMPSANIAFPRVQPQ